ncbi:cyclic pyranopterin monophosphate synthase MoaC [Oribacterium sp. WCC10]|uniref:cyclic pyranopterin monophosphate synthase MoaC n=1 Tax=Oribacterium sp. WCC10 TaxID=1855343 RepID=UPI0008EBC03D|nr:cyclic pyranopterin monophosphate synthase MoaC [Oribacterium sp. WCC10]SFG29501.1 cyclic pyranopterin phosphate synthase [Oribacterium sp. WCC10]
MTDNTNEFSHFDDNGNAYMVDVSGKDITRRMALARGTIKVTEEVFDAIEGKKIKKGDVLTVAQVAGIMGAKKTSELIPMCHILLLTNAKVWFEMDRETTSITAFCQVKTEGKTGVEMEALTGVNVALLTIYDMCKAIDKRMIMSDIHLVEKDGGKSGDFRFDASDKGYGADES